MDQIPSPSEQGGQKRARHDDGGARFCVWRVVTLISFQARRIPYRQGYRASQGGPGSNLGPIVLQNRSLWIIIWWIII